MVCECGHRETDHVLVSMCEEQIHYPSEDYPCFCTGYKEGPGGRCTECNHPRAAHGTHHVCRPDGNEICTCRRLSTAASR